MRPSFLVQECLKGFFSKVPKFLKKKKKEKKASNANYIIKPTKTNNALFPVH